MSTVGHILCHKLVIWCRQQHKTKEQQKNIKQTKIDIALVSALMEHSKILYSGEGLLPGYINVRKHLWKICMETERSDE